MRLALGLVVAAVMVFAGDPSRLLAEERYAEVVTERLFDSVASPVSDAFRRRAERAARSIPHKVWQDIRASGWQIVLAEFVLDAAPGLHGVQPRGWPAGSTWNNSDALHLPGSRLLVLAEKRWTMAGEVVPSSRVAGVLRHEIGHAFDMATGESYLFHSARPEFVRAYESDLLQLDADQQSRLEYFVQYASAGRQEAFAEAFALILGGGSARQQQAGFQEAFPNVVEYLRNVLKPFQ